MDPLPGDREDVSRQRVSELEAELEELRARVGLLEAEKAALLRAVNERDYERPPHYL